MARVFGGGKVTIPELVREVLKIEEGDYVRVSISQVIKKQQKQQQKKKTRERKETETGR